MNILADASLPYLAYWFPKPFSLSYYETQQQLSSCIQDQRILLCRSTLQVSRQLLENTSIECVATASSGVEHIADNYLKEQDIVLFDAKGANAVAVADFVTACIALLYPNKQYIRQRAAIVGLGAVGTQVAKRLDAAGFELVYVDPPQALNNPLFKSSNMSDLLTCDLICIHANWHDDTPFPTHNLFDATLLSQLKPGTTIINAARGRIVNENDLLSVQPRLNYCTDVYCAEPAINPAIIEVASLCTPHIAGHSIEAKESAIRHLSEKIHHHYGLIPPHHRRRTATKPIAINPSDTWQQAILSIYDPRIETEYLKKASNKQQAFISCRNAHQHRHDFIRYDSTELHPQLRRLLGHPANQHGH